MSLEQNKAIVRRFIEEHLGENSQRVNDELLAPDCRIYFYAPGTPLPLDRESWKGLCAMLRAALPDIGDRAEEVIAEGDLVAVRWSGGGTHTGEFMGIPPTGKYVSATGIFIGHVKDGRIVEGWENWDALGFMQQLGAIPAPAAAGAA